MFFESSAKIYRSLIAMTRTGYVSGQSPLLWIVFSCKSLHSCSLFFDASYSFKNFIMRTLKEIQEMYKISGVKALRDVELLHMVGISIENCDIKQLFNSNREELIRKGYKPGTAARITALGEIAHRYSLIPMPVLAPLQSSSAAAKLVIPQLKDLSHEECWVLYLNRANKLLSKEMLSSGGVSATVVDVKMVVKRALELLASSIILVHNHPSGNNNPGEHDKVQTKVLKDAAGLFDITLLDHIIVAGDSYFSFADDGIV